MSKVLFIGSIQGFRGKLGNLIFRQMPDGTTVVSEAPPEKTRRQKKRDKLKRSPRQKAHNNRFQEAARYARRAARTQPAYMEAAEVSPMQTAYNFALSDWFHAPEIHGIDRQAGRIRVEASDNFLVSRVQVTVLNGEGNILEKGEAVQGEGSWWEFVSQAEGTNIVAEAWDLAGNMTRSTFGEDLRDTCTCVPVQVSIL